MIQRYAPKPKRARRSEGTEFNTEETSYVPKRSLTVQSNKEIFQKIALLKIITIRYLRDEQNVNVTTSMLETFYVSDNFRIFVANLRCW